MLPHTKSFRMCIVQAVNQIVNGENVVRAIARHAIPNNIDQGKFRDSPVKDYLHVDSDFV